MAPTPRTNCSTILTPCWAKMPVSLIEWPAFRRVIPRLGLLTLSETVVQVLPHRPVCLVLLTVEAKVKADASPLLAIAHLRDVVHFGVERLGHDDLSSAKTELLRAQLLTEPTTLPRLQ